MTSVDGLKDQNQPGVLPQSGSQHQPDVTGRERALSSWCDRRSQREKASSGVSSSKVSKRHVRAVCRRWARLQRHKEASQIDWKKKKQTHQDTKSDGLDSDLVEWRPQKEKQDIHFATQASREQARLRRRPSANSRNSLRVRAGPECPGRVQANSGGSQTDRDAVGSIFFFSLQRVITFSLMTSNPPLLPPHIQYFFVQ